MSNVQCASPDRPRQFKTQYVWYRLAVYFHYAHQDRIYYCISNYIHTRRPGIAATDFSPFRAQRITVNQTLPSRTYEIVRIALPGSLSSSTLIGPVTFRNHFAVVLVYYRCSVAHHIRPRSTAHTIHLPTSSHPPRNSSHPRTLLNAPSPPPPPPPAPCPQTHQASAAPPANSPPSPSDSPTPSIGSPWPAIPAAYSQSRAAL